MTSAPPGARPAAAASARRAPSVPRPRVPLLLAGLVCLLAALWGGLLLLGLPVPTLLASTAADHGPLMALGFLGTVISLERAVALGRRWGYAAPALAGTGGLAVLVSLPPVVGRLLLCTASIVLVVVYVVVHRIQPALHLRVMAAGAVCWYVATLLWLTGWTLPRLVPWIAGFLVLTILGERLELARVAMLTRSSVRQFLLAAGLFGAGLVLTTIAGAATQVGVRLVGAGMIGLAAWGAAHDVARRTVKIAGVTRFMAVCLLTGYVWLLVGGVIWLVAGDLGAGIAVYDAALHAVFLGFVMSMIFGHAPVIVPAVMRVRLPYRGWFYAHVALLHVSLLVRVVLGDALGLTAWWHVGGVGTELAILLFLGASVTAVVRARRAAPVRSQVRAASTEETR
ncbi:MAG TPA: hypothetical protein VFW79_14560 [Cellulomonas sp.]|uniref:hypothetical protein n=1 Tax=Cellulomonas sp. TaxID=40001 RepID=UPI002E365AA2|nr:hypothetical protein [Cellulomonas sp.]HEX5333859.1 hypothetical protein [Cellulomonas sp.]